MRYPKRAGIAALALSAALVGGGSAALATTGSNTATTKAAASSPTSPSAGRDAFLASVASHLGVTKDKLTAAIKAAQLDRVAADLAAGKISADQATAARAAIESGNGPGFEPGGPGHGGPGDHHGAGLDAAAAYLGLTATQLRDQLQAGKTLADVATAQGKTVAGLKAAMLAGARSHLDTDVKAGRITAAQEQTMLDQLSQRLDDMIQHAPPGPPPAN
jgi:hypothetical protein